MSSSKMLSIKFNNPCGLPSWNIARPTTIWHGPLRGMTSCRWSWTEENGPWYNFKSSSTPCGLILTTDTGKRKTWSATSCPRNSSMRNSQINLYRTSPRSGRRRSRNQFRWPQCQCCPEPAVQLRERSRSGTGWQTDKPIGIGRNPHPNTSFGLFPKVPIPGPVTIPISIIEDSSQPEPSF